MKPSTEGEARKLEPLVFGGASQGDGRAVTLSDEHLTQRSGSKMVAETKKESAR